MTSKPGFSRASGKSETDGRAGKPAPRRSRPTTTRSRASTPPSKGTSTSPQYRFVGGKGGVGKTTCAAALGAAAAIRGQRVLVISTDPASSLGDAFNLPASRAATRDRPRRVTVPGGSLHIIEIDAARALERWLGARRDALERIAVRGTWLDEEDVSRLLRLSLPGIDEIAALFEITRAGRSGDFDLVVVDTAPTGHTLRMLAMPDTLVAMARVFDHMQEKHRVMVSALRGGWTPDAEDELIRGLADDGAELGDLLRDPARVALSWVSLPEPMSIEETADAAARLQESGIPLGSIIVNRITPPPPTRCGWCDARRGFEAGALAMLAERIPGITVATIAERGREPRDLRALASIGKAIGAPPPVLSGRRAGSPRDWRAPVTRGRPAAFPGLAHGSARLVMFGGKGGTGKTTCAAAAAIDAAHESPARRVLLLSVDPAHSLADVFGVAVGDEPRTIPGAPPNLLVRELDASRGFAEVRARYASAIDALFDRLTRGSGVIDATNDRLVMHDLIDLAPPGIDELAAVIDVVETLEENTGDGFDVIVVDTAPTGHALRLLETPAVVQDWARAFMSILLKYQPVVGIGELGAILLKLSQALGRIRELLEDSARAHFIVVTRAAALPRAETVRLLTRLRSMRIDVAAIVVNAVGRGTCANCRAAGVAQRREISALHAATSRHPVAIVITPAEVPPPHGSAQLRRWRATWRRAAAASKA